MLSVKIRVIRVKIGAEGSFCQNGLKEAWCKVGAFQARETALQRAKPAQIATDTPVNRGCLLFVHTSQNLQI